MKTNQKVMVWSIGILLLTCAAGCRKKTPVAGAPPAPAPTVPAAPRPTAPTISEFTAEPSHIERGQSALLRWQVKDATEVEINHEIGAVSTSGRRQIAPADSTTYTLTAKGPGGTASGETTLNVTLAPPAPPAPPHPATLSLSERLRKEVQDAYFDFDRSYLRKDAVTALTQDAAALKSIMTDFPATTIVIEGHCDERGSAEYNIGLGDRRASSAKDFLTELGVSGDRLITISYGKERPQCTESNESCWQKNRRVHFVPGENQQPKASSELNESGAGQNPSPKTEKGDI
jgi:peptidoglycan-associated lipoprotein